MPRSILFDFNGVLIDDEHQHCAALIATLAEYDIAIDEATYFREYLGFDDPECFRHAFGGAGLPAGPGEVAHAVDRKGARYEAMIAEDMRMVPGAVAFVRTAAERGFGIGIVSGARRREIDVVLHRTGLDGVVQAIVAAEDVEHCKPDPAGYRAALAALAIGPGQGVAIEDSLPGLRAARGVGLRCAMLSTSYPPDALAAADLVWPDFVGRTPEDLPWP